MRARGSPSPDDSGASLTHERRENVVGEGGDLALGEAGRVWIGRYVLAEFCGGEAVAALVLVGIFVEVRHFRAGPAAGNHFNQLLAVEPGLVQIRCLPRRARITVAVAVDPVAELAIRL